MGVDLQKKPPIQRPPVAPIPFIFDRAYAHGSVGSESRPPGRHGLRLPMVVTAKCSVGGSGLPVGTSVTITSRASGPAKIWAVDNGTPWMADVVGPEAMLISKVCQLAQTGLVGTVISSETTRGVAQCQVSIDAV